MKRPSLQIFLIFVVLFVYNAETSSINLYDSWVENGEDTSSIPWPIISKMHLHRPPPAEVTDIPKTLATKYIDQKLDNFDPLNTATWKMRYMSNDQYYKPGGPIFVMIGGEWTISSGYLVTGQMVKAAQQHNGYMFYTEHRYYGESRPTDNLSVENMKYLTTDQALADLAFFIQQKKLELNATKVIVYGGSYAGNLAAWVRIKYPHLVQGAVASSAPVEAEADFKEYMEVVNDSLATVDQKCVDNIRNATGEIEKLLLTDEGAEKISTLFNLCKKLDRHDEATVSTFMETIAGSYAGVVQYAGTGDLARACKPMLEGSGEPIEKLAKYISGSQCIDPSYSNVIFYYNQTSWSSLAASGIRQWIYQTCTEYGYYQTSASKKQPFGTKFPLEYFTKMCTDIYGKQVDSNVLEQGVNRTNWIYGGRHPDVTNVAFIHGSVDPWHALGILEDLSDKTPAFFVKGTSHCADLANSSDVKEMVTVQEKLQSLITKWLSE